MCGNGVGAQLVNALPGPGGLDAGQMLTRPMKALVLLHTEPIYDAADAAAARIALADSGLVVALTSFNDGVADSPSVTITASDDDWIKIVNGQLNPQMAFMTGKIKVKGNIGLATKLGTLFL